MATLDAVGAPMGNTPAERIRAMVPPTKPAPAVPEARRMAILRASDGAGLTAIGYAARLSREAIGEEWHPLYGLSPASIARLVSDVAREGWIADDGKKPRRYTLTAQGRTALACAS
jgi:hypothetical protein